MKVLVTGGLGLVGRSVVRRLAERDYTVRVIDRHGGECVEGVECITCDINDYAAVREQVRGQDAIIHLAAIPNPAGASGTEIFRINCAGTFNVYEAAAVEGIRRIATASSINWLGYYYGVKDFPIQYFPIDEEHPGITTDAYSFSKQVTEEIAAYYWRREGISSTCLRMPAVIDLTEERFRRMKEFFPRSLAMYNEWAAMPEVERLERLSKTLEKSAAWRAGRWLEISL